MSDLLDDDKDPSPWLVWGKRIVGTAVLLAIVYGLVKLGHDLANSTTPRQKQMAKVHLLPDMPPPPPPREENKPPPKETPKEVKVEQPKQEQAQASEQLKMEGQGSDTGLAGVTAGKVSNDYAGQVIKEAGGRQFDWFKGVLQRHVQSALQTCEPLRKDEYRVVVKLWLNSDGAVKKAELVDSTGNPEIDKRLRTVLASLPAMMDRPPEGLPQPITMRLTSRS